MNINTVSQSLCRICLKLVEEKEPVINLFVDTKESKEILNTIYICFQMILTEDKYLPSIICFDCIKELNAAYSFRQKCITFEERFAVLSKQFEAITPKCESQEIREDDSQNDTLFIDSNQVDHDTKDVDVTNKNNKYQCTICNKVLKTESSLLKHHEQMHKKRKHPGKVTGFGTDRRYHCTRCSYSTPHSQTLVNHVRRHNGDRPYHCECGKTFTQSSSLSAHRKTHDNTTYYTCTVCGKQFKHAFTLKKHSRVHENAQFTCSICKKKLKSHESLQSHMHRHYNIRNFNCEDCGDTFVTSSELLNHRKKHNSVKKVECHLCGYKTHTKKNLIVHLKRHAGDKSYKCDQCHVTFFSSGDVQRHQRVHTREKPFTCPICVQRFTYSPSLNKHMLTVHNIKYKWADFKWKESRMSLKTSV
ncbi:zinc finger protein 271-like [Colias croceus]|uniref:zinc finger protein 271-like n=1 Tax=Colias crocea TaxID=72248 RepID=UPI001E27BF92|nr:zinc finger protein 271-like [Colias croceus]